MGCDVFYGKHVRSAKLIKEDGDLKKMQSKQGEGSSAQAN
jgi:hypothetical protein